MPAGRGLKFNTGRAVIGVSCRGDGVSWPCWREYRNTYIYKDSKSAGGYRNSWGKRGWVLHPRKCCARGVRAIVWSKFCELGPCFKESQCARVVLSYLCMIRLLSRAGGSCDLWMVHGVCVQTVHGRSSSQFRCPQSWHSYMAPAPIDITTKHSVKGSWHSSSCCCCRRRCASRSNYEHTHSQAFGVQRRIDPRITGSIRHREQLRFNGQ